MSWLDKCIDQHLGRKMREENMEESELDGRW